MGRYLWQRYFILEIVKAFFFFYICLFLLSSLVDYATHIQEMRSNVEIPLSKLLCYYGMLFFTRSTLFIPLAFLLSIVKVLSILKQNNELLVLQTVGISPCSLSYPFFFIGLLCVAMNYINFEFIFPKSCSYIHHFEEAFFGKRGDVLQNRVNILVLEEEGKLFYQRYDSYKKEFFDVFWVLSIDEIYHMKTLSLIPKPFGVCVDIIKRNENGILEKVCSYDTYLFEHLKLNRKVIKNLHRFSESDSMSELFRMVLTYPRLSYDNRNIILTHLYFKIMIPWLPIIVLMGMIPFCICLTKTFSSFFLFVFAIFGSISLFTVMNACVILSEAQILTPFVSIFLLPIILLVIFSGCFCMSMCSCSNFLKNIEDGS